MSQHFLADPQTASCFIERSGIGPTDVVLEIGAGLGALTFPLARSALKVFAVELDKTLFTLLEQRLEGTGADNIVLIQGDILKFNIAHLSESEGCRLVVVGNLPYHISSQILIKLLRSRSAVQRAILTFQKELAHRIMAPCGNRVYGRLSVLVQYAATAHSIGSIQPTQFYPSPRVESEVIELVFHKEPRYFIHQEAFFFSVVKAAFGHRRKTLRNALSDSELGIAQEDIVEGLNQAEIDPSRRAETLSIGEFARLSEILAEKRPVVAF